MAKNNINFNTYVERDLTKTTVDWGTVASKLTTDLGIIRKDREKKRADIENETIEVDRQLNELEDYSAPTLQNLALGMSGDSANFLRVQNDLFKRGQITQTQFGQARQRVLGDWKQFGNISKRWESDYAQMKSRVDNGEASTFEAWLSEQNTAFGNLKNVTGYVNPQTGNLSLVRLDKDGNIPTDPSKHVGMNTINNRFANKIDNVVHNGALTKKLKSEVDTLGKLVLAEVYEDGEMLTTEGQVQALNSEGIQNFLETQASAYTTNPNTVFSILGDINGNYSATMDPKEAAADPYKVLLKFNENDIAVPVETAPNWEKQQTAAKEIIKDKMILMLDNVESAKTGDVYTEYQKALIAAKNRNTTMQENAIKKKNEKDNEIEIEDLTIRPPMYNSNPNDTFGKNSETTVYEYLDSQLGSDFDLSATDEKIGKTIKNSITGVMDANIFSGLNNGEYPSEYKPLDFEYSDDGADHFFVELGTSGRLRWPPKENFTVDGVTYEGENNTYWKGITSGDFENIELMYAYLKENLIDPQSKIFQDLAEKKAGELDL